MNYIGLIVFFGMVIVSLISYAEMKKEGLEKGLAIMLCSSLVVALFFVAMALFTNKPILGTFVFAVICWLFPRDRLVMTMTNVIERASKKQVSGAP